MSEGPFVIAFADGDVLPKTFSGEGAELAAKQAFKAFEKSWNCQLLGPLESGSAVGDVAHFEALLRRTVKLLQCQREQLDEHWKPVLQREADEQEKCASIANDCIGLLMNAFDLLKPEIKQSN